MSATVTKIPDEPIIVVTVDGHLDVEIARDVYAQIAALAQQIEGPIFRITDVRKQECSFMEMMAVIKEASQGATGTTSDPRITNIFVGRDKMAMLARDVLKRIDPEGHGVLETVDDALEYVRWQLKLKSQKPAS